jgi:hypothetical protein
MVSSQRYDDGTREVIGDRRAKMKRVVGIGGGGDKATMDHGWTRGEAIMH